MRGGDKMERTGREDGAGLLSHGHTRSQEGQPASHLIQLPRKQTLSCCTGRM